MKKQTIGVLFGGRSGEHEVSLNSATAIVNNFDREKYNVVPIAIAKTGQWYGPVADDDVSCFKAETYQGQEVTILPQPGGKLVNLNMGETVAQLDGIFPIIHGTYGEDGILQGLFELANIPYVGAGVAGSAVGMDKLIMRKILAYHDIPQVNFIAVSRSELGRKMEKIILDIEATMAYPLFVKPANAGSSVGISKVTSSDQLRQGLTYAAQFDNKLLVEQGVNVREIEISVLGNEQPIASVAGEIVPSNEFYDYKAKYIDNKSVAHIPAQLSDSQAEQIKQIALAVYNALECSGFARIDFFIDKDDGAIYLNEINTLPGFTEISMYPKLWEATGLSMPELLDRLVVLAMERFDDRQRNKMDFC